MNAAGFHLDFMTLAIILALTHAGNVVFSFLLWISRRGFPGAGIWVIGQLCVVLGTAGSLLLRQVLPPFWGIALPNVITLAGALCLFDAIWHFRFAKACPWWVWLALPVFLGVMVALLGASVNERIIAYSLFIGASNLATGLLLIHRTEPGVGLATWLTSLAFLVMVPVQVLRAWLAITGPQITVLGAQDDLSLWLYLISILSAYLLLFGYFLMTSLRYEAELRRLNDTNLFMMAVISHDLRSPVRSASRYVDRHLLPPSVNLDAKREALKILGQSLRTSATLLDHLLAWAQERQHPDAPGRSEVLAVAGLVDQSLALLAEGIREKSLVLVREDGEAAMVGDRQMAASVFRNVLTNAVRHSPPGARITVRAEKEAAMLRVAVIDAGPGINPHILERLREGGPVPRLFGNAEDVGTSLGLSLCHRFMRRQGGWLEIASQPGQGSCFTMVFPADNPGARPG